MPHTMYPWLFPTTAAALLSADRYSPISSGLPLFSLNSTQVTSLGSASSSFRRPMMYSLVRLAAIRARKRTDTHPHCQGARTTKGCGSRRQESTIPQVGFATGAQNGNLSQSTLLG